MFTVSLYFQLLEISVKLRLEHLELLTLFFKFSKIRLFGVSLGLGVGDVGYRPVDWTEAALAILWDQQKKDILHIGCEFVSSKFLTFRQFGFNIIKVENL